MAVETLIEDDRWLAAGLEDLALRAADAALRHIALDPETCEISVLGCDDARIAVLNAQFRGKPAPTNVLSWPAFDMAPEMDGQAPDALVIEPEEIPLFLGDIAISYDTCLTEAEATGKPLADHVVHLIVHGVLHLLGYDHVRDGDATLMERLEVEILGKLGVDDPYYVDTRA